MINDLNEYPNPIPNRNFPTAKLKIIFVNTYAKKKK